MQLRNSLLTALGASAAMVLFLYSMQFGQFGSHPFVSESNAVALTFFFLAWAAVADAARGRAASARPPWVLVTFGLVMAAACAFCKISVGAVCLGTGVYLLVRTHARSIAIYPVTAAGVVVWVVLVHTFIYRFGAEYINIADPVGWDVRGLVTRYSNMFAFFNGPEWALGLVVAAAGAFLAPIPQARRRSVRRALVRGDLVPLEALAICTLLSIAGAVMAGDNPSNAFYFLSVQLFAAIPFLIAGGIVATRRCPVRPSAFVLTSLVGLLCVLATIGSKPIASELRRCYGDYKELRRPSAGTAMMAQLLPALRRLHAEPDRAEACVFIPHDQGWYYGADSRLGASFVVPAYAGVPHVYGAVDSVRKVGYGFHLYRDHAGTDVGLSKALSAARDMGFKTLIVFYGVGSELRERRFDLTARG